MVKCERSGIACNHANYEDENKMKIICNKKKDICYLTRYCRSMGHVVFANNAESCKDR